MVSLAAMGSEGSVFYATFNLLSVVLVLCTLSYVDGKIFDEKVVLLEFKKSVSDPYGILNSWNADNSNHCSWFGVSCNSNLRVSGLKIRGNLSLAPSCSLYSESGLHGFGIRRNCSEKNGKLVGKLSPVIGNLTELRVVSLPFNEIDGEIPVEIWGLRNLEVLDLEGNFIVGEFSGYEFNGLEKLRVLNLASNRIFGQFPPSLSKCRVLRILNLARNDINDVIPGYVGALSKLRVVNLSFNRLVGSIPNNLGNDCGNLEHLDLSVNFLKGKIPRALGNCRNLRTLLLSSNALYGIIPNELGRVRTLEVLDVSRNSLRGPLPANLGNCINLSVLVLSHHFNVLPRKQNPRGETSPGLSRAALNDNNFFEGSIPDEITTLPKLKIIWAPGAHLGGKFPTKWGSCKSLMMVNLAQNLFTGGVGNIFPRCNHLRYFNLSSNRLTGRFDQKLGVSCTTVFDISANELSGPIPTFSPNACHHLSSTRNKVFAPFNPSSTYLSFFSYKALSECGTPFSKPRLSVIHNFSQNKLNGVVPVLPISPEGTAEKIEYSFLDGGNCLSSPLNKSLCGRSDASAILVFNPSKNRISGLIASKIHRQEGEKPEKTQDSKMGNGLSILVLASVITISVVTTLILAFLAFCCYNKKKRQSSRIKTLASPQIDPVMVFNNIGLSLTYDSILQATGNFSRSNCIGSGGFGSTYKAEISTGNILAVKRLTTARNQGAPQFHAEVSVLGRIKHPNLITLIGYYASEAEMFLIYNYLPGGNLDRFIRQRDSRSFNWSTLHKICLNIASALSYLHEQCNPRVLHRDIKPSNILLDDDCNAYLSDFGLSRLLSTTESQATTRVAGTYGYIAPEYALTGRISNKADVYSYGVVMLELMSDKRVLDPSFYSHDDGFNIVSWARMIMEQGEVKDFFLASLWDSGPRDELVKLLHLAINCTVDSLSARLTMKQVVQQLKQLQPPTG